MKKAKAKRRPKLCYYFLPHKWKYNHTQRTCLRCHQVENHLLGGDHPK